MARGFNYAPGASADVELAASPVATKGMLLEFGLSRNPVVRATVGARADCPLGLAVTLAHDAVAAVRAAVAANPHTQRTVLEYLAGDRQVEVLLALVRNPGLPPAVVERLAAHHKSEVRRAVVLRLAGDADAPDAAVEDAGTPELREWSLPPFAADALIPHAGAEPTRTASALTRTAPVRGFRPPPPG